MAKFTSKEEVLTDKVREGLKVQFRNNEYLFVGVVSRVLDKTTFELVGAKTMFREGKWFFDSTAIVNVKASDNWDVLEVRNA